MKTNLAKTILGIFSVGVLLISGCTKTPSPCFTVDKGGVAKVNEEVQFDASCSADTKSYSWDFGDGTSAVGNPVKHKYPTAATYVVKLTATNKKKTEILSKNVVINP